MANGLILASIVSITIFFIISITEKVDIESFAQDYNSEFNFDNPQLDDDMNETNLEKILKLILLLEGVIYCIINSAVLIKWVRIEVKYQNCMTTVQRTHINKSYLLKRFGICVELEINSPILSLCISFREFFAQMN